MLYKIKWLEEKTTSTGKVKAEATLIEPSGTEIDKVTIWADFPNFKDLRPESTVDGEVVTKKNGVYLNKTLYKAKATPKWATAVPPKKPEVAPIVQAAKTTASSVEAAQDRKESSMEKFAVIRDATLLTTAYINQEIATVFSLDDIKAIWVEWKKWLEARISEPFS